ncbi:MAG: HEAT repeat domain-containing protein [Planctomycetes bacterium]|nr:HEAT repeat domain-containing protein [Planctomycetota bacterium]
MRTLTRFGAWLLASSTLLTAAPLAAQEKLPDLTRNGKRDETHDWTLGPTGARGWMFAEHLETKFARQILVTQVDDKSPADGVLAPGDVLLGVGEKPFADDARKVLGLAIDSAERDGKLELLRWRNGKQTTVTLKLRKLGTYSKNAPFDCPKSTRILDEACAHIAQRGLGDGLLADLDALALLASGKPHYLDLVRDHAKQVAPRDLALEDGPGMKAWDWGWTSLFLAEYHLATHDDSVLPALREYTLHIARGQSGVGTWGHGMALANEQRSLGGYGALNQAGLGCWLSLVLARECGVKDPAVDGAIDTSRDFFAFFTEKGSIPYGDHPPLWELHDNNGKNAQAAVAFDALGDVAPARYFARMTTASYDERELGHTGNFFGYLWGPLGVAVAGHDALAAHMEELRWSFDLARRWDGGFTYQGGAGEDDSYAGWDVTGAYALACALPLAKLRITGRGRSSAAALAPDEARSTIADGRGFDPAEPKVAYDSETTEALLARLSSWSPVVRFRAAGALARRPGDCVPQLIALLASPERDARLGACHALELQGKRASPATDALLAVLATDDAWLKIRAAYALAAIGPDARKAAPELLRLVAKEDPADPRGTSSRYLGLALFLDGYLDDAPERGLLADSFEGVDRELLYAAVRRMLRLDDGHARSTVASVYKKLEGAELDPLLPDIVRATERAAPSGEMFADGVRLAGLELLARLRVREGMRVALDYARTQNPWDSQDRMAVILAALKPYGAHAKELLPELKTLVKACQEEQDFPDDCKAKKVAAVEEAIRFVSAATEKPELRSLAGPGSAAPKRANEPKKGAAREDGSKTGRDERKSAADKKSKRVRAFVLAGQSNMLGQAVVDLDGSDYNDGKGTLARLVKDKAKAPLFRGLLDARGRFTTRDDVRVRFQPEDGAVKTGSLDFGFTGYEGRHHFGPELGIGHVLGDALDEPVLLIKTAWGGKSLFVDFRPPSAGGSVGPYYTKLCAEVREALASEPKGRDVELAGLVWFQGWNDLCDDQAIPEYEANLVHLIHDLRREWKAPALPVVIGELGNGGTEASPEMLAMRRAQKNAAERAEFAGTVRFVETTAFQRAAEESPCPGHLHHEFANAETYWLTGRALGEAMVELIAKPK